MNDNVIKYDCANAGTFHIGGRGYREVRDQAGNLLGKGPEGFVEFTVPEPMTVTITRIDQN